MHVLAIGYSPAYLSSNDDGIRQEWPRVPLPRSKDTLEASAELGRRVAALLDTESAVAGVTAGTIRSELRELGNVQRLSGGALDPSAGELDLTAGWGHVGRADVVMPGQGKVVARDYSATEVEALAHGAQGLGLSLNDSFRCLGKTTCDVYLNGMAYWRNVPSAVWEYRVGGYQVVKKWLSYRERELLGRSLSGDDVRGVTSMIRRLAAILLLFPALDDNYQRSRAHTRAWNGTA